jgi:formylglycine-generating enzyme required for sulfatase activity
MAQSASTAPATPALDLAEDRSGVFVYSARPHRGAVDWTIDLTVDTSSLPAGSGSLEWQPFGVEMVYVPEGSFWLGDTDPKAVSMNAYFRSNAAGGPAGLYQVTSEGQIEVGPKEGAVWYTVAQPEYQGDRRGPIPAAFPKGFQAFYLMKYELTQGQYAAMLNQLSEQASNFRAIQGGLGYQKHRGSIQIRDDRFEAAAPARPANWVSWNDGIAYAAFARLRPMTEFEFTKACRGPAPPAAPNDFPWGTSSKAGLRRLIVAPNDDLISSGDADESMLSDETRERFGASFYWVMDLAGSVWERVVTPATEIGRAFRGSHGEGRVSAFGSVATNPDWPKGDEAPGGYGYRGGGYYAHGFEAGEFNPHSPTEWRRFGAWGQGPRSVAYGFRAARTAPRKP